MITQLLNFNPNQEKDYIQTVINLILLKQVIRYNKTLEKLKNEVLDQSLSDMLLKNSMS